MMLKDSGQALFDPAPRRCTTLLRLVLCTHVRRAARRPRPTATRPGVDPRRARMSESAEALDFALDRMIDGIIRQDRPERR